jgi:hypothetical protein
MEFFVTLSIVLLAQLASCLSETTLKGIQPTSIIRFFARVQPSMANHKGNKEDIGLRPGRPAVQCFYSRLEVPVRVARFAGILCSVYLSGQWLYIHNLYIPGSLGNTAIEWIVSSQCVVIMPFALHSPLLGSKALPEIVSSLCNPRLTQSLGAPPTNHKELASKGICEAKLILAACAWVSFTFLAGKGKTLLFFTCKHLQMYLLVSPWMKLMPLAMYKLYRVGSLRNTELDPTPLLLGFGVAALCSTASFVSVALPESCLSMNMSDQMISAYAGLAGTVGLFTVVQEHQFVGFTQTLQ